MKRLESILLYAHDVSSSDQALQRAEALASSNDALLWVVDVLPSRERPWSTLGGGPESRQAVVAERLPAVDRPGADPAGDPRQGDQDQNDLSQAHVLLDRRVHEIQPRADGLVAGEIVERVVGMHRHEPKYVTPDDGV